MKIQLDSSALTTLMEAAGPEFIVEITQAVADNFSRRYLHSLASAPEIKQSLERARTAVNDAVREEFMKMFGSLDTRTYLGNVRVNLRPEVKEAIRGHALECYQTDLREAVKEEVGRLSREVIEDRVNRRLERLMDEEINERAQKLFNAKLAEFRRAADAATAT